MGPTHLRDGSEILAISVHSDMGYIDRFVYRRHCFPGNSVIKVYFSSGHKE